MNSLIESCRYYKGETECPACLTEKGLASLWFYEQIWVESEDLRDENGENTVGYINYGLKDFNKDDGTPLSLKALLFNRHTHWCGGWGKENDIKSFKEWYNNSYMALPE